MAIGIQDQYFGTEIEMTGITRQRAAEVVAELFGTRSVYDGGYYQTWSVRDQEGKKWKFMYDGSIYTERRERGRMVRAGSEYSTEMVSPKLSYGEMGKLQEVVRCLRHHGARVNESCGQHVHVDASNHTPRSLKNAMTIMYSKEDILFKALKVQTSRESHYCQKVRPIVLEKIRRMPNSTISMEKLRQIWYGGRDGSHNHYDSSRYYALNLQCFRRERWNGGVLKALSMQEKYGPISRWLLPFPLRPSIRNVPRCGKQRLPRILRLHSVPFYCGWGLSDRNIKMSGNICLPTWKGIGRGDMTAVPMNV